MPANFDSSNIPDLVKHVAMAIYYKGPTITNPPQEEWIPKTIGIDSTRFIVAFKMAINSLTKQGYVAPGSTADPEGFITLTGRGQERDLKHRMDNPGASLDFDLRYRNAFAPPEKREPPPPKNQGPGPMRQQGLPPPSPQVDAFTNRAKVSRKLKRESLTQSTFQGIKRGVRRVKRSVAKRIQSTVRRRPPKGRV